MYKLIASDLDQTLLDTDHRICERNLRAIRAAHERGVRFVAASGRGHRSVGQQLAELGLLGDPNEWCIAFNGGVVATCDGPTPVEYVTMPFERIEELWRFGIECGLCIHVYTLADVVYVWNYPPEEREYVGTRMDVVETDAVSLDFLRNEPLVKILFMDLDQERLRWVHTTLGSSVADLDVSYSSNRYIEFNPQGVNKGAGLLALGRHLGIDPAEMIAIGDGVNDLPMICAAGLGACVANAYDEVKEKSDYVCSANNDEGGVAEVIERFVLNA